MFRLLAILGVVAAFGGTLYFGGDRLEAWESPQAAAEAAEASAPKSKKKAKGKRRSHKAKKAAPRIPGWITRLEALCERGEAQTESIRPPSSPRDSARYFKEFARLNERWNHMAAKLLRHSAGRSNSHVKQLLPLMVQEEALVQSMLAASRKGDFGRLSGLSKALLRVAKAENRLLIKMDAVACTVSPDVFRL